MWKENNNKLERNFKFADFKEAMVFIQMIAFAAEKLDHHPEIINVYNKVDIKLYTHTAKDSVTEKDKILAGEIDRIYNKYFSNL